MPAPTTPNDFLDCVRKSGLVREAALAQALDKYTHNPNTGTVDGLANALVADGLLTRFQAKQLKLGRHKRFMVAGKYRLLELIGVGGMGAVYLCEHIFMKRLVAVKVLPIEKLSDPSNLERFYREARAVAALDHPNIVRAYDIDKADNLHFLVMEYVDGASIQEVIARFGKMDPLRAANYIAQSAIGMQHGSELSMVHRDIKPGNLLLDRTGTIKLLDMGLARFFNDSDDNLTAKYDDKCVLGTADYLAPEQALSNVVDIRADIYALGGTFYFMLTGVSPVPEGTIAQKLVFHQTQHPQAVTDFRRDVPEGMLKVLRKMLEKRPEDRYQTPMDVAEALVEWAQTPMNVPPENEMPNLCPAVLMLMGQPEKLRAANVANRSRILLPTGGGGNSSAKFDRGFASNTPLPPNSQHVQLQQVELLDASETGTTRGEVTTPMPMGRRHAASMESVDLLGQQSLTQMIADSSTNLRGSGRASKLWLWVALTVGLVVFASIVAVAVLYLN